MLLIRLARSSSRGNRIKVAGDVLQFDELFVSAENLVTDQEGFQKRLASDPVAISALRDFRTVLAAAESMTHDALEPQLKQFAEQRGVKLGVCISALRIAVTGKSNGLGILDYFEILGKEESLKRIDRCLTRLEN